MPPRRRALPLECVRPCADCGAPCRLVRAPHQHRDVVVLCAACLDARAQAAKDARATAPRVKRPRRQRPATDC